MFSAKSVLGMKGRAEFITSLDPIYNTTTFYSERTQKENKSNCYEVCKVLQKCFF